MSNVGKLIYPNPANNTRNDGTFQGTPGNITPVMV